MTHDIVAKMTMDRLIHVNNVCIGADSWVELFLQVSIEDLEEAFSQNKMSTFMESLGISTDDA